MKKIFSTVTLLLFAFLGYKIFFYTEGGIRIFYFLQYIPMLISALVCLTAINKKNDRKENINEIMMFLLTVLVINFGIILTNGLDISQGVLAVFFL